MMSLLTTPTMNVVGSNVQPSVTIAAVAPSTTAPLKSSSSKARLLFNSDGSVKLLGDPSSFGINENSHTLVPTVGPDGQMTMLLTPADGNGKTFILNPTNGASLPNPNILLTSSTNTPFISNVGIQSSSVSKLLSTVQNVTNTSGGIKTAVVTKPFPPKPRPIILTSDERRKVTLPAQKSLLSGMSRNIQPQHVTHMRIDPSGSCTSTVSVQVAPESTPKLDFSQTNTSKSMYGSTALKNIIERVRPNTLSQQQKHNPGTHNMQTTNKQLITVHPDGSKTQLLISADGSRTAGGTQHVGGTKYATASNNQWTQLSSVIPPSAGRSQAPILIIPTTVANTQPVKQNMTPNTGLSKNLLMVPSVKPGPTYSNGSGTYTVVFSANTSTPTSTVQSSVQTSSSNTPTLTFNNGSASIFNTKVSSTVTPVTTIPRSSMTSSGQIQPTVVFPYEQTSKPLKFVVKDGKLVEAKFSNVTQTSSSTATDIPQKLIVKMPIVKSHKTATSVSQNGDDQSLNVGTRTVLADCKTSESDDIMLDPISGQLVSDKPDCPSNEAEDDVMSIKIDSVFSLSTKELAEDDVIVKEESLDSEVQIVGEKKCEENPVFVDDQPKTITCHPSYVVLEQLSRNQIEKPKELIIKCSDYCRKRTLNFLCSLGLVNCKPTVHTINPIKNEADAEEKPVSKKKVKKRKRAEDEETTGSVKENSIKQQEEDDEVVTAKADSAELTEHNAIPEQSTESSPKVRKVGSPGNTCTKVIRFTKVEKEQICANAVNKSPVKSSLTEISNVGVISSLKSTTKQVSPTPRLSSTIAQTTTQKVMQLAKTLSSKLPMTRVADNNNKHYFLFNLNGQNILVPISNDMNKPKAFVVKDNTSGTSVKSSGASTSLPTTQSAVSAVNRAMTKSQDTLNQLSNQKRPLESASKSENIAKVSKTTSKEALPLGIRIKSEPVTHGYGDEEPPIKSSKVKVKEEPVDSEWQEIWSSASRPVTDPKTMSDIKKSKKKKKHSSKAVPEETLKHTFATSETSPGDGEEEDVPMPDLPMMKVPSTKEIAQKSAAHNDRIERLKAMLREKEKLIEELKMKRLEEGPALDDEDDICVTKDDHCGLETGQALGDDKEANVVKDTQVDLLQGSALGKEDEIGVTNDSQGGFENAPDLGDEEEAGVAKDCQVGLEQGPALGEVDETCVTRDSVGEFTSVSTEDDTPDDSNRTETNVATENMDKSREHINDDTQGSSFEDLQ